MIRKWLDSGRKSSPHKPRGNKSNLGGTEFGQFEHLEDRRVLAFVGFFNGVTLDLMQTIDHGDAVVDNSGLGNAFRVTDNSGTLSFVASTNVSVTMLNGTANQLNFNINNAHSGNAVLNLGNGPRDVFFSGGLNTINGNLTVNGGTGPQNINLAPLNGIPIRHRTNGSATFNLGNDFDIVYNNENFVVIGGNLSMTGVNLFRYTDFRLPFPLDADLKVGGNMTMDTSNESTESFLLEGGTWHDPAPLQNLRSIISGNFTYIGGDDIDHVNLNDTFVRGNVNIDLGAGIPFFGDPQNVTTTLTLQKLIGPYAEFGGNVEIKAGDSNLGNVINLDGYITGNTFKYTGGDLVDNVTYSLIGTQVNITAVMGGGDDIFTVKRLNFPAPPAWPGVNVMDIDFGNDSGDMIVNNYGKFTFDALISNYHWFNHDYTVGDNTLRLTQLIDTGDVTIDNKGGLSGVDWRVLTNLGIPGSTTTAATLILNMLDNTGNNVYMDLDNPVLAFMTLNLGNGDRNVEFTGTSNNPLRDLSINADVGIQNVALSVNAPLAVATLAINLGAGFDTVVDNANNLLLAEDLVLQGVNKFQNNGILSIARHAVIMVGAELEDTLFANNATMFVGGNFTYVGGTRLDEVRLNGAGGTTITGTTIIDLGDNTGAGTQTALLNGNNNIFSGPLTINSVGALNPDLVLTSATSTLGGTVKVNLGAGKNDATVVGKFGGFLVQYDGTSGVDTVTFGTTVAPADYLVKLGTGNDTFNLLAGAVIAPRSLSVDFGGGLDTFNNSYGPFNFNASLLGLNGFNHVYTNSTKTLVSTQVSSTGPVTIDDNGPSQSIRFNSGTTSIVTPVNKMTVNMLNNSGSNLNVDLDNAFAGELALNLGDGARALNLTGASNSFGGNLTITGGSDAQTVEVAVNNDLSVTGNMIVDLGQGNDSVDEDGRMISVTGSLTFAGVNTFDNGGTMSVGGNVTVNTASETATTVFDNDASMTIGGNFTYTGGNGRDEVTLDSAVATTIAGFATIDLGNNTAGGTQIASLNSAATSVGGAVTVKSTNASSPDSFASLAGTTLGGDIDINLGGGLNDAAILGLFGGTTVKYNGGSSTDNVTFGTTGNAADANIKLSSGDDTFLLKAGTSISPTAAFRVDFGGGNDTFTNQYGDYDFDAKLLDWQGFDRFYDLASDSLNIIQVLGTGNVTIDNNGVSGAIRLIGSTTTEMTPATNLRMDLLNNTATNVVVDLDSALAGNLILQLRSGARTVSLTGSNNSVGGLLRIEAADGVQNVTLATNADLVVGGNLVVNGRDGIDVVDDGNHDISVAGSMFLRSVNNFENDHVLAVGGDFNFVTVLESQATQFKNNGSFSLGGHLTYLGGSGVDEILFNSGGVNINGTTYISLGEGIGSAVSQRVRLTGGFSTASLAIVAGTATGGNRVITDAATNIAGDVTVNFTGTTTANSALFFGNYGGTYGTYRGGSVDDTVVFGAVASNMYFVSLMAGGSDHFTLEASTDLAQMLLNFGDGVDTFVDNLGQPYSFPAVIVNL